jgi:hypothetical protein
MRDLICGRNAHLLAVARRTAARRALTVADD